MFDLAPTKRRLIYVASFEALAIILSTLILMVMSDGDAQNSLPVAIIVSAIAVTWNYLFNSAFEAMERRLQIAHRSLALRTVHAVSFEAGLVLATVPLYMIWYGVGLWQAFQMEVTLLVFFLIFTFVFTWIFDQIFALPNQSAQRTR